MHCGYEGAVWRSVRERWKTGHVHHLEWLFTIKGWKLQKVTPLYGLSYAQISYMEALGSFILFLLNEMKRPSTYLWNMQMQQIQANNRTGPEKFALNFVFQHWKPAEWVQIMVQSTPAVELSDAPPASLHAGPEGSQWRRTGPNNQPPDMTIQFLSLHLMGWKWFSGCCNYRQYILSKSKHPKQTSKLFKCIF